MLIRPELRALPVAPVQDEGLGRLESALSAGARISRVVFRIAGTPRAGEPKMDFHLEGDDSTSVITVMYGRKTRSLLETGSIPVENA